jgi:hypothetical protein
LSIECQRASTGYNDTNICASGGMKRLGSVSPSPLNSCHTTGV